MAEAVGLRYGNNEQCQAFVGVLGELSIDTDHKTIHVHVGDGAPGGTELARVDMSNVSTSSLASAQGHSGKNLLYTDLSNLNDSIQSTPEDVSKALVDTYGLALSDGSNLDTSIITASPANGKPVATTDMSNVNTVNLATSTGHSGKNLAYADLSNVDNGTITDNLLQESYALEDLSNINTANLAIGRVESGGNGNKNLAYADLSNVDTSKISADLELDSYEKIENKDNIIVPGNSTNNSHYPTVGAVISYVSDLSSGGVDTDKFANNTLSNIIDWSAATANDSDVFYNFRLDIDSFGSNYSIGEIYDTDIVDQSIDPSEPGGPYYLRIRIDQINPSGGVIAASLLTSFDAFLTSSKINYAAAKTSIVDLGGKGGNLTLNSSVAEVVPGYLMKDDLSNISSQGQAKFDAKQNALNTNQLNAVNSGITSNKVSTYDGYATSKQNTLTAGTGISISNDVISVTGQVSSLNGVTGIYIANTEAEAQAYSAANPNVLVLALA